MPAPTIVEVRFPEDISRGATGGPRFKTIIVTGAAGSEQRIMQWQTARWEWDVSHALRNPTQAQTLLSFFLARGGRTDGFRFKDWMDYQATDVLLAHGGSTSVQLTKTYTSGAVSYVRNIYKPVAASVTFKVNGVALGTATYSTTTGIVTLAGALGGGDVLTWSGEFDCPVRFDTDEMDIEQQDVGIRNWSRIPLVELRG
jgi:uncharacterized protein (TIGR02217 family)